MLSLSSEGKKDQNFEVNEFFFKALPRKIKIVKITAENIKLEKRKIRLDK